MAVTKQEHAAGWGLQRMKRQIYTRARMGQGRSTERGQVHAVSKQEHTDSQELFGRPRGRHEQKLIYVAGEEHWLRAGSRNFKTGTSCILGMNWQT